MWESTEETFAGDLRLRLTASAAGIRAIEFEPLMESGAATNGNPLLTEAVRQLRAYFAGQLRHFELPLDLAGTEFQRRVWLELTRIPYGETRSYQEMARAIGAPKAVRAVGAANGANPIAIVVPCHRVVGASGKLVGYGGGLPLKRRLLTLERGGLFA
ncbi:MAG: methylated-DNA--[protein]-cysteine S-methyltransferase [Bryobacteraceae bacterium]